MKRKLAKLKMDLASGVRVPRKAAYSTIEDRQLKGRQTMKGIGSKFVGNLPTLTTKPVQLAYLTREIAEIEKDMKAPLEFDFPEEVNEAIARIGLDLAEDPIDDNDHDGAA